MSAILKYEEALKTMPTPGGAGCHVAIMGAANLGVLAGIGQTQVFNDIRASIPQGKRHVPDGEIVKTIQKAFNEVVSSDQAGPARWAGAPVPEKPAFDGIKERQRLIDTSAGVQEVDLWELSPERIDKQPGAWETVRFLEALYGMDEFVFMGDVYDTMVFTVAEHILCTKDDGKTFPHIIANPMTGDPSITGNGTESYRCDGSVAAYRYALVEFDDLPRDDQVAFWYTMIAVNKLPVACLIDSGGKSIHAWLEVNLDTKENWDKHVRNKLYGKTNGIMSLMGADTACKNPSRLSRTPGHLRQDKGKYQRLLYLKPQPHGKAAE